MTMQINIPEIVAEVTAEFMRYEKALGSNDVDTIDTLFWNHERTLRYGPQGTMLGHAQISAFRHGRKIAGIKRTLRNTVITTFGRDFATANTESEHHGTGLISRQSQTWVRTPDGWKIVSAHVSQEAPAK
jgi:hypothetical protein